MKLIAQYKGLPKQVYIICAARIITAMGAFIFSFSTLLMTGILGMSEIETSYMMIGSSVMSMLGAVLGGRLADRFPRKKVLLSIMIFEIAVLITGGFVVFQRWVLVCMLLVSFCFSGFLPVLSAMITDVTTEKNRKESFSLLYLCINIGYSLGQVIAGLLFYDHTRWIFWGQAVAFAIASGLIFLLAEDSSAASHPAKSVCPSSDAPLESAALGEGSRRQTFGRFRRCVARDRVLLIFLAAIILTQFCYAEVSYLMPLQLSHTFGLRVSSRWVSYVWMLNGFCCVLLTPLLLSATRRFSQIVNVTAAAMLYAVGFGSYAFVGQGRLWLAAALAPVWTAGEVLIGTGTGVFIADRARPGFRATYQSLYELSCNIGRCLGPLAMGHLLQLVSYHQGWYLTFFLGMAAAGILICCYGQYRKEKSPPAS